MSTPGEPPPPPSEPEPSRTGEGVRFIEDTEDWDELIMLPADPDDPECPNGKVAFFKDGQLVEEIGDAPSRWSRFASLLKHLVRRH